MKMGAGGGSSEKFVPLTSSPGVIIYKESTMSYGKN
jgi:hypothetical protein